MNLIAGCDAHHLIVPQLADGMNPSHIQVARFASIRSPRHRIRRERHEHDWSDDNPCNEKTKSPHSLATNRAKRGPDTNSKYGTNNNAEEKHDRWWQNFIRSGKVACLQGIEDEKAPVILGTRRPVSQPGPARSPTAAGFWNRSSDTGPWKGHQALWYFYYEVFIHSHRST